MYLNRVYLGLAVPQVYNNKVHGPSRLHAKGRNTGSPEVVLQWCWRLFGCEGEWGTKTWALYSICHEPYHPINPISKSYTLNPINALNPKLSTLNPKP